MAGADDGVFGPTQYELGSVSACTRCSLMAARVLLMDQSLIENSWAFFEGISVEAMMYQSAEHQSEEEVRASVPYLLCDLSPVDSAAMMSVLRIGDAVDRLLALAAAGPAAVVLTKPPESCMMFAPDSNRIYFYDSHGGKVPGNDGACLLLYTADHATRLKAFLASVFPFMELGGGYQAEMYNALDATYFRLAEHVSTPLFPSQTM